LLKAQTKAGYALKDLGLRMESTHFEASRLGGRVNISYDGTQQLRQVDVADDALESVDGDREKLAQALLAAMQEAFDNSQQGTKGDVWQTYRENRQLMDAPLNQLGAGGTAEDPWANVTLTNETLKLAEELFTKFDLDEDGYWSLSETSKVQLATEGTDMQEEAFNALIIAAAPDGGRKLTEEDLAKGLSRQQVIELYTDAKRQRQLGFVLDIYKDHAKVFAENDEDAPELETQPPAVD